jgi:ABC-2 type transport system permease protein
VPALLRALDELGIGFKDLNTEESSLEDIFVSLVRGEREQHGMSVPRFNHHGVWAIYKFEIARTLRTLLQSIATPVITTSLYFVVFGSAIGSRMSNVDGVPYGAFIVPGLIMLAVLTESISTHRSPSTCRNSPAPSTSCCRRRYHHSRWCWPMSARRPPSRWCLGLLILRHGLLFVPLQILHPWWMLGFLILMTALSFCLFGFVIGIWANGWEQLQFIPMLVVTPLTFLGGTFYSIAMLPPLWQKLALFNPVVYLISGFRWSFNDRHPRASRAPCADRWLRARAGRRPSSPRPTPGSWRRLSGAWDEAPKSADSAGRRVVGPSERLSRDSARATSRATGVRTPSGLRSCAHGGHPP